MNILHQSPKNESQTNGLQRSLLYLSQSEGVLAALWLGDGCQISSTSTRQFTLETARLVSDGLCSVASQRRAKGAEDKNEVNTDHVTESGVSPPTCALYVCANALRSHGEIDPAERNNDSVLI